MSTTIRQVQTPTNPTMKDLLDAFRTDLLRNLNCHHVGTVQSFDSEDQLATATINYTKTFFQYNQSTGSYSSYTEDYPVLIDCPVVVLGGGSASLTFPIQQGDECLVLFNDRDLDNWFNGGPGAQVATPRLHSFSDGIIIVGLRSSANTLDNYDTTRAVLQNGTTMVGVGPSKVKISNDTTTLNTLLGDLITAIKDLSIDVAGVGTAVGTVDATSVTVLTALATQIGGLLE
jgi:hypothetical protein